MKLKTFYIVVLLLSNWALVSAQTDKSMQQAHHEHHANELGIAVNPVYFLKEKILTYGLHTHYVRAIKNTNFGIGLGYERIFDAHKHQTIGIVGSYSPLERLVFNMSPGVTFEQGGSVQFALHLETSYEFELHDFHLGPAFEFAYDPEDYHLSLGLHLAYGF